MMLLNLFWTFFKIGLFTIGGGYAMIPMIMTEVVGNGWLTESALLDFIAIAESTPGPFAINIATFVGATTEGFFGAIMCTLGVVLPSFIVITIIAYVFSNLMKNVYVQRVFGGLKPAVVGLLAAACVSVGCVVVFGSSQFGAGFFSGFDVISLILLIIIFIISRLKIKKKSINPILLICISAVLGLTAYSLFS